jgi:hypothetical protein
MKTKPQYGFFLLVLATGFMIWCREALISLVSSIPRIVSKTEIIRFSGA